MNAAQLQLSTDSDRRAVPCGSAPQRRESAPTPDAVRLTTGARVIFDHMDARQRSVGEIARGAGFHPAAVRRHLEALREAGLVNGNGGTWSRA